MSEGIPYADIIIIALVAGFILLRLRSVLGQKNDGDQLRGFSRNIPAAQPQEPIVQLDDKSIKAKPRPEADVYMAGVTDSAITDAINEIKARDPQFTATSFLLGARMAFEMIFDAFAKGDKPTLKMLLAEPIYDDFSGEIDKRSGQENKTETTLVSVQAKNITHATLEKNMARISVHFASEQISLVRDAKGAIIEGSPSDVHHIENDWVFERDVTSRNPNWKIIET